MRDFKANKNRRATGVVIESALHRGRGAVATVLVQNGTLRVGDIVVVGGTFGKVRALIDDKGKQVKKAGPSIPVEVMGLSDVPAAGDTLIGRQRRTRRARNRREARDAAPRRAHGGHRLAARFARDLHVDAGRGQARALNLIIKADGQGSLEALARAHGVALDRGRRDSRHPRRRRRDLAQRRQPGERLERGADRLQHPARRDGSTRLAENEGVDLRFYQVIYEIEDDLKKAMRGMLAPVVREVVLGHAEVREVFKVSKVGTIVGCYVTAGKITRNAKARVVRDAAVVFDGEIESLRRFKDDVREVAEGFECGIQIAKFQDLKEGDVIEAYAIEQVAAELVHA